MKVYTYNDKVLVNSANDKWLKKVDGPIVLSPFTIRIEFNNISNISTSATVTQVSDNIYDITYNNTSWSNLISYTWAPINVTVPANSIGTARIIAANTTGVTNLYRAFVGFYKESDSSQLKFIGDVPLFDTSSVTNFSDVFSGDITNIPDFDVSSVTNCSYAFSGCTKVESGALNLYQKLSALGAQVTNYNSCFNNCGRDTVTGAAELAQIPTSWGGTAS